MKYILFFCLTGFLFSDEPVWTTYYDTKPGFEKSYSVEFSPDGDLIVVDGWINVHLLRTEDGEILHTITNAKSCSFDATGDFIYYIKSGNLFKMDVTTFESTEFIDLVNGGGACHRYSFDKSNLVLGLGVKKDEFGQVSSRGIDIYNLSKGELEKHIDFWIPSKTTITISSNNELLSWNYSYYDQNIESDVNLGAIYNIANNEEIFSGENINLLSFHPTENVAIGYENNSYVLINLYDFSTIKNLNEYNIKSTNISSYFPWNYDGSLFFYFGYDNKFNITNGLFEESPEDNTRIPLQSNFIYDVDLVNGNFVRGSAGISLFDLSPYLSVENENVFGLNVSPNPVNEILNISYQLESPSEVQVYITDILGNQLDIIQTGLQSNLNQTINYPVSNLPAGTYFLTLSANGINESIQFVKE